jgi:hypothetical protein
MSLKHSRNLLNHTYTSEPHGLGTLTPIEFFQQDLLWQSSNTRSHSCSIKLPNTRRDNPSSGYRSTCTLQRHLGVYIINPPFISPRRSDVSTVHRSAPNHVQPLLVLWLNSSKSIEVRRQQFRYYGTQLQLVYIVAWQLKVRPSIIVAYLRKPHICNNITTL